MKSLATKLMFAAMLAGTAILATTPANARVSLSIGLGGPAYYGYNYNRPCSFYRTHDLPAPARCREYLSSYWGPQVYADGDFIFRDRDHWSHWKGRDDYRHWKDHDWSGGDHHR